MNDGDAQTSIAATLDQTVPFDIGRLTGHPVRAWSLIVTVFGDAVAPRGGSIWLGNLLSIMGAMGIDGGVVRTALSRLVADGWVERERAGRNSFYRLTPSAAQVSDTAAERIYGTQCNWPFDGWRMAVVPDDAGGDVRATLKDELRAMGAGALSAATFVWPRSQTDGPLMLLAGAANALIIDVAPCTPERDMAIAARGWPLERMAAQFASLSRSLDAIERARDRMSGEQEQACLVLRLILVHELRRVVLKTPRLPVDVLGPGWPETAIRVRAAALYRTLLAPSEAWLDRHGRILDGRLPAASEVLGRRFG